MKRSALAGVLAGGVALAMGELVAGVRGSRTAPVIAVGDEVIERVPRPVKDLAIDVFGTADKVALLVGIYALLAVVAALVGVVAARRFVLGASGIAAFGVVGALAGAPVDSLLGAACGVTALWFLLRDDGAAVADESRRRFLVGAAGAVGFAATTAAVGRYLQGRVSAAASRAAVVLPRPRRMAAALPTGSDLGIDGLTPFTTPNDDFYRIDTALIVPQVETEGWTLRIHGLVERELTLTYADLLDRDFVEEDITIACVSNEIGDDLIGNARWLGTPLLPLLEEAGVLDTADQVVGRSVDGFTVGFPVSALDGTRPALLAIGMNGEALPIRHGFPARLVVSGLYGYVSATKWLSEIELTRFDAFDQYWVQRGWEARAPIKTQSRIDTPRPSSRVPADTEIAIAGVAWAQTRGISAVEVRVDDGPWEEATLAAVPNEHTWRQWVLRTTLAAGSHRIAVRATDGDGETQTEARVAPFPDGATGWHAITVNAG
jgi:DMSO/TMAO reductase YedYZ molybdopterin-dependent catalytic subunit